MSRDFLKGYCQLYAEMRGRDNNVPASAFVERLAGRFLGKEALTRHVPSTQSMGTVTVDGMGEIDAYLDGFEYTDDEGDGTGAVTPEMLAGVYERLMGDNHDKGAYYTPREIVDYMCRESLVGYLWDSCQLADEKSIRRLVNGLDADGMDAQQRQGVLDALWRVRICDPSVGAGAFPMGWLRLLKRVYAALGWEARLDWEKGRPRPDTAILDIKDTQDLARLDWEEGRPRPDTAILDIKDTQDLARLDWEEGRPRPDTATWRELVRHIIEHNLYGMDIDAGAVEVTKYRLMIAAGTEVKTNMWVGDTLINGSLLCAGSLCRAEDGPPPSPGVLCPSPGRFDIVAGNPPYFVYQQGHGGEIETLRAEADYQIAFGGKLNAYKLFLACALNRLCRPGGVIAYIFQNSFLGDRQAARLRQFVLKERQILSIDSFPERDSRHKRVFKDAKMSVCITVIQNSKGDTARMFPVRIWDDKTMCSGMHTTFAYTDIAAIDPEGYAIPRIRREDIPKMMAMRSKAQIRLKCYEGELNITTHRRYFIQGGLTRRGRPSPQSVDPGPIVLKGASIQRYRITMEMSQGQVEYLDEDAFMRNCGDSEKAWHHQHARIAMQGMTGANDIRRLVMTVVPAGCYMANSCNYILPPEGMSVYALLAILNSEPVNWYFRRFSTNSNVNVYEVERLPIPRLTPEQDDRLAALAQTMINDPSDTVTNLQIDSLVTKIYSCDQKG